MPQLCQHTHIFAMTSTIDTVRALVVQFDVALHAFDLSAATWAHEKVMQLVKYQSELVEVYAGVRFEDVIFEAAHNKRYDVVDFICRHICWPGSDLQQGINNAVCMTGYLQGIKTCLDHELWVHYSSYSAAHAETRIDFFPVTFLQACMNHNHLACAQWLMAWMYKEFHVLPQFKYLKQCHNATTAFVCEYYIGKCTL
jgi:hypothetical protein